MNTKEIPCPACKTSIPFVVEDLLMGKTYSCPNTSCGVKINLSEESTEVAQNAYDELQSIKQGHSPNSQ